MWRRPSRESGRPGCGAPVDDLAATQPSLPSLPPSLPSSLTATPIGTPPQPVRGEQPGRMSLPPQGTPQGGPSIPRGMGQPAAATLPLYGTAEQRAEWMLSRHVGRRVVLYTGRTEPVWPYTGLDVCGVVRGFASWRDGTRVVHVDAERVGEYPDTRRWQVPVAAVGIIQPLGNGDSGVPR